MAKTPLTPASARAKAAICRKAASLTSDAAIRQELLSLAAAFDAKAAASVSTAPAG